MDWEQTVPRVSPYLENTSISTEVRGSLLQYGATRAAGGSGSGLSV